MKAAITQINPNNKKEMMDVRQASGYLGIRVNTLYEWTSMKRIPHFKIGGRSLKFDRQVLDKWIEEQKVEAKEW